MKRRRIVGYLVAPSGERIAVRDKHSAEAIKAMAHQMRSVEAQRDQLMLDCQRLAADLGKLQNTWWVRLGEVLRVVRIGRAKPL